MSPRIRSEAVRRWTRRGLVLLPLLLPGWVLGAQAQGAPGELSEAEVACDALRIGSLLERIAVTAVAAPGNTKTTGLTLSFTASGDFAGIATSGSAPGSPGAALAFSTNPEETTLLRNPARPQLFSVSWTRNDLSSNLVAAGDADELRLSLNPTLDLVNPPVGNLLALNNLNAQAGAAAQSTDAKPGRGLGSSLVACHGDFSARDVHVFRVLSRIVRVEVPGARSVKLAIYRRTFVGNYRLEADAFDASGASLGRLSAAFSVASDLARPPGELGRASLVIFAPCQPGFNTECTRLVGDGAIALFKPVASGLPPPTPYRASTAGPIFVEVDLADLLADTTWRRPP